MIIGTCAGRLREHQELVSSLRAELQDAVAQRGIAADKAAAIEADYEDERQLRLQHEDVRTRAEYSTNFDFCANSVREKDWRCRKRGTQRHDPERVISPEWLARGPLSVCTHSALEILVE